MNEFINKRIKNALKSKYDENSYDESDNESENESEYDEESMEESEDDDLNLWGQEFRVAIDRMLKPLHLHPDDITDITETLIEWLQKNPMP